jgi:hypothetical protein
MGGGDGCYASGRKQDTRDQEDFLGHFFGSPGVARSLVANNAADCIFRRAAGAGFSWNSGN